MDLLEKSEKISRYIRDCNNIIHIKGHDIAKEYGLTYDQYHLLLFLQRNIDEPPSIRDLSKRFKRAQNTTSEKITRLEEKDLLEKITDEEDRRIMRVKIKDEGIRIIDEIRKERTHRVTYKALKKMKEEDIDKLLISLEFLYENIKEEM